MGVAVDQAGDGHHAGGIDDGLGRFLGGNLVQIYDFAVLNADVGTKEYFHAGIHGHGGHIGNQSLQSGVILSKGEYMKGRLFYSERAESCRVI